MKLLLVIPAFVLVAAAQSDDVKVAKEKAALENALTNEIRTARVISITGAVMGTTVKNAPYAADEVHETTQTLADGTKIHNEDKTKVFRDSEGRVRRETGNEVSIFDPTTGSHYVRNGSVDAVRKQQLNTFTMRTDTVGKSGAPGAETGTGSVAIAGGKGGRGGVMTFSGPNGPATLILRPGGDAAETADTKNVKTEALGTQSFDGILAEGTRTTTTIPAGTIGNDRPLDIVLERWYSPDLQVTVMTKRTDPRTGEEITRLNNIRRGEQDPTLFQAPPLKNVREME